MSKLTVLHLSDAHWSEAKDHSERVLIDRLLDDLRVMKARGVVPDIVIFSGDLVQAGEDKHVFPRAYEALLKPICEVLEITADRLFICPGNHDLSRKTAREQALLEEGLKGTLISEDSLNQFIRRAHEGAPMERMALDRLTNFYKWHDTQFPDFIAASQFCRLKTVEVSGKQVGVCLMNSAWRATGESGNVDEGQLILGSIFAEKAIDSH